MEKEITLQDIERRLAALETAVAALTAAEKSRGNPSGRFAHLGGKYVGSVRSVETPEKSLDFSSISGKRVR